jgi:hypothetical protein
VHRPLHPEVVTLDPLLQVLGDIVGGPMIVGYARTSTLDQQAGVDAQARDLKALGCERIFQEQISSIGPRKQLGPLVGAEAGTGRHAG